MHGRLGRDSSITVPCDRHLPLFCCSISFVGVDNLRDVRHGVGAAHDGQVDAERHLRGRMPQPLRHHVQRDPPRWSASDGRHCAGGYGPRLSGARSRAPHHPSWHVRCQPAGAAEQSSWSDRQRDPVGHRTRASWRTGWPGPGEAGQSGPCRPCRGGPAGSRP